jgi:hypothetical protein
MLIPSALAGIAMGIFLCSQPEFGSRPLRYWLLCCSSGLWWGGIWKGNEVSCSWAVVASASAVVRLRACVAGSWQYAVRIKREKGKQIAWRVPQRA